MSAAVVEYVGNPLNVAGHPRVNSCNIATNSPRNNSHKFEATVVTSHRQWSARVALATSQVVATPRSCAHHAGGKTNEPPTITEDARTSAVGWNVDLSPLQTGCDTSLIWNRTSLSDCADKQYNLYSRCVMTHRSRAFPTRSLGRFFPRTTALPVGKSVVRCRRAQLGLSVWEELKERTNVDYKSVLTCVQEEKTRLRLANVIVEVESWVQLMLDDFSHSVCSFRSFVETSIVFTDNNKHVSRVSTANQTSKLWHVFAYNQFKIYWPDWDAVGCGENPAWLKDRTATNVATRFGSAHKKYLLTPHVNEVRWHVWC